MFTIGGMKFYGNPETDNMVWSYPADGSDDSIIPVNYFVLDEAGYNAIRAVQIAEAAPTEEQLLNAARVERDALLATAGLRISPLQDAVDLEVATDIDKASLKLWKQYRVAVNRVPDQTGYPAVIEWPTVPD